MPIFAPLGAGRRRSVAFRRANTPEVGRGTPSVRGTMAEQSTATAEGARRHARAMAGTRVECMPTVPSTGGSPPSEVFHDRLLWDEVVGAGGYAAKRLNRGARLRLVDLRGDGCASMLLFNAE